MKRGGEDCSWMLSHYACEKEAERMMSSDQCGRLGKNNPVRWVEEVERSDHNETRGTPVVGGRRQLGMWWG